MTNISSRHIANEIKMIVEIPAIFEATNSGGCQKDIHHFGQTETGAQRHLLVGYKMLLKTVQVIYIDKMANIQGATVNTVGRVAGHQHKLLPIHIEAIENFEEIGIIFWPIPSVTILEGVFGYDSKWRSIHHPIPFAKEGFVHVEILDVSYRVFSDAEGLHGIHYWSVTCAAADISSKRIFDLFRRQLITLRTH